MKKYRQGGAAFLLELSIVLIISSLAMAAELKQQRDQMIDARYKAQGDLMVTLNGGVNTYVANNYAALVNGNAVSGYANPYAPTIAELVAQGLLPTGFSGTSMLGPAYAVTVSRVPSGCTPPACDISALTYINGSITDPSTGRVDVAGLGTAALEMGGDAGYSDSISPTTILGIGGAFSLPNPVSGTPAGVLAIRTGYGSSSFAQFLRRDGTLPMTGTLAALDINATGNIKATGNLTANGTVSGATVNSSGDMNAGGTVSSMDVAASRNVTAGSNINAAQSISTPGIVEGGRLVTATAGNAANPFYDVSGNHIAADSSLYSYGKICSQNSNGDCTGTGGTVIDGGNVTAGAQVTANTLYAYGPSYAIGGLNSYSTVYNTSDSWAFAGYSGGWGGNSAPGSAAGSVYVNDVYLRSVGRWASQVLTGANSLGANGYKVLDSSGLAMQWGYTSNHGWGPIYQGFNYCYAYTSVFVDVITTGRASGGADGHDYIGSWDRCGFTFDSEPNSGGTMWFAIGF